MKNSGVIPCIAIIGILSLGAMELELQNLSKKSSSIDRYVSLTESVCDGIQEQAQALFKPIVIKSARAYLNAMHSSLKLDQWYGFFSALSEKSQRRIMKAVSLPLLHWHAVVLCLPAEIVRNHVIYSMLDGEEDAVEQFYDLPFVQAFDLYHCLKVGLRGTQLVGPLYAKSEHVRNLILKLQKKPWYYSAPIANFEDKQEIDLLPGDIKNMYLAGKNIVVLPDDEHNDCTREKLCNHALGVGGSGVLIFGVITGFFTLLGFGVGNPGLACDPTVLAISGGGSFGVAGVMICGLPLIAGCNLCRHSQGVTI